MSDESSSVPQPYGTTPSDVDTSGYDPEHGSKISLKRALREYAQRKQHMVARVAERVWETAANAEDDGIALRAAAYLRDTLHGKPGSSVEANTGSQVQRTVIIGLSPQDPPPLPGEPRAPEREVVHDPSVTGPKRYFPEWRDKPEEPQEAEFELREPPSSSESHPEPSSDA